MPLSDTRVRWWRLAATAVAVALLAACSDGASDAGPQAAPEGSVPLSVLAFTSSAPGWNASIPAFGATEGGQGISVATTYGPSTDITESILAGTTADVVYLADEPNMNRLVREDKVDADWSTGSYQGRPFGSISTLMVREGNPLNIQGWADLLRPGVEVIAANPVLSGSGKYGLMAGYAAASEGNKNPEAGYDYLNKLILEHVLVGPTTVAEAIDLFLAGTGDVLIAPENSALEAERHSAGATRVVPAATLRIDNQVAVVATSAHPEEAARMVDYLYTPEAQRLWAEAGFRPVLPEVAQEFAEDFPAPQALYTIDDLGGWAIVEPRFFDPENGIISKIFNQATA
ncbi:sulfate ABC transporter substrate-binding protein [soil metagenome]